MNRPRPIVGLWVATTLLVVACAAIASRGGSWLAPGPRFDLGEEPLVIDGERLAGCLPTDGNRFGPLHRGGVRLYTNVDLSFRAVTRESSGTQLFVVARGRPLDGEWPLLTLHVDRSFRRGFFVGSRDWRLYRIELDLPPGEHHFRLSYVNDRSRYPISRDADLEVVGLGQVPASIARRFYEADAELPPADGVEPLRLSHGSHVVVADRFDLDSGSEFVDGAKTLWSGGYIGRTVVVPERSTWRLVLRAHGDLCDGEGPRVLVVADAEQIATWEIGAEPHRDTSVELPLEPGEHEIVLVYLNDKQIPGVCDRNLHVAWLRFERSAPEGGRSAP